MTDQKTKTDYYKEAAVYLNSGVEVGFNGGHLVFLTRGSSDSQLATFLMLALGIHQLATRAMSDAMTSFNGVLEEKPTNLIALLGKVRSRCLMRRRKFKRPCRAASCTPSGTSPRRSRPSDASLSSTRGVSPTPASASGCVSGRWGTRQRQRLRGSGVSTSCVAFHPLNRSRNVLSETQNPTSWPAQLLLGLEALNASKNPDSPEAERTHSYTLGTRMVERAFKANQRNATAANALCELFLRKGSWERVRRCFVFCAPSARTNLAYA